MQRVNWTRDELILAFNLSCKIPFGQIHQHNPKIIELSTIINRTPSSITFKLSNFASLDPFHQKRGVKGLQNSGKLDREIYEEFSKNWDDLIYESEMLLAKKSNPTTFKETEIEYITKEGTDKIRAVKTRVNQAFFRNVVTTNYGNKCAVSNIDLPELLVASHIIPWAANESERLNPSNGICLSPLYDKALDRGFITISDDYKIILSKELLKISDRETHEDFFARFENQQINLPDKFLPKPEFLEFHRKNIFKS